MFIFLFLIASYFKSYDLPSTLPPPAPPLYNPSFPALIFLSSFFHPLTASLPFVYLLVLRERYNSFPPVIIFLFFIFCNSSSCFFPPFFPFLTHYPISSRPFPPLFPTYNPALSPQDALSLLPVRLRGGGSRGRKGR